MQKKIEYQIKAVFPNQKAFESYIKNHRPQRDESILLFGSNINGYEARYNPKKDKIVLQLTGKNNDELTKANVKFFRYVDSLFQRK